MKKEREKTFTSLESFELAEPTVFGITVTRFKDEETDSWVYRPILELEVEASGDHLLLLALDIFDADLYDVCYDAVVAGSKFTPGFFDNIAMFDEAGEVVENGVPFTVSDIMADIETPLIDPAELSKDRVLH
jgi:hypothetical protein